MRAVRVTQPRPDTLELQVGRDVSRAAAALVTAVAWLSAAALVQVGWAQGLLLAAGLVVVPLLAVVAFRALQPATRTLVRGPGRLLLDGEPLELARVELRVVQRLFLRTPSAYQLSLWVMTSSGPEDLPVGVYRTLLEASHLSGTIEDFVQRGNARRLEATG